MHEIYIQKWNMWLKSLFSPKLLFLLALIMILIIFVFRLSCETYGEDILITTVIILISIYCPIYFGK